MINDTISLELYKRAKLRLNAIDPEFNDTEKVELYKLELEIQNEDLIAIDSERQQLFDKYRYLYENAPVAYFTLGENGLIKEVNNAGSEIFGLSHESLVNKCFSRFVCIESQMTFSAYKTKAFKTRALERCEIKLMSKYNSAMYALIEGQVIVSNINLEAEFLIFVNNITEHKQFEQKKNYNYYQLQQTDKRNVISELAATLAHELNHPLTVILNYVQGCIRRIESGNTNVDEILKALKNASKQSTRASEIILRMKNYQNNGVMKFGKSCLNSLIREIIELLQYELDGLPVDICFRPTYSQSINCDKIHLQQALLNLLRNSIEAMRDAKIENPQLIVETNRVSIDKIEIDVIDNGPGLSDENKHRIFEPHFTTKVYGMGLGLALCQAIIIAHNGKIFAVNAPFQGACFKIELNLNNEHF